MKPYITPTSAVDVAPTKRPKLLGKPSLARAARISRTEAGLTLKEVAEEADADEPLVHRWGNGNEPHAPSVLHVVGMRGKAKPVGVALVRWQGEQLELQVLDRAKPLHPDDDAARLSTVITECTDPVRALATAFADNHVDDSELEGIAREAREGAQTLLSLEAWAVEELLKRRGGR